MGSLGLVSPMMASLSVMTLKDNGDIITPTSISSAVIHRRPVPVPRVRKVILMDLQFSLGATDGPVISLPQGGGEITPLGHDFPHEKGQMFPLALW